MISQVDSNILNRDYGNNKGDLQSGGGLYEIAGISIRRSNNLPFMLDGAGANNVVDIPGENNNYAGNFTTHAGLIYHKDAAAVWLLVPKCKLLVPMCVQVSGRPGHWSSRHGR